MKLEVGKYYKTRSGLKAKIISDELNTAYKYVALLYGESTIGTTYLATGGHCPSNEPDEYDLMEEWYEPLIEEFECRWILNRLSGDSIDSIAPFGDGVYLKLKQFLNKRTKIRIEEIK